MCDDDGLYSAQERYRYANFRAWKAMIAAGEEISSEEWNAIPGKAISLIPMSILGQMKYVDETTGAVALGMDASPSKYLKVLQQVYVDELKRLSEMPDILAVTREVARG